MATGKTARSLPTADISTSIRTARSCISPRRRTREIAELGVRLNATYVPFGQQGQAAQERQVAQDKNASMASPQAVVQRALTKSSHNYVNTYWDLVDAVRAKSVDVGKLKDEDLPKDMKGMNAEQRANYVDTKAKERADLQAKVQQLNEQRSKFIAERRQSSRAARRWARPSSRPSASRPARRTTRSSPPSLLPTRARHAERVPAKPELSKHNLHNSLLSPDRHEHAWATRGGWPMRLPSRVRKEWPEWVAAASELADGDAQTIGKSRLRYHNPWIALRIRH